ncbi:MAG: hypothetical protein IT209_01600 [Armatimonadetes bacterium]|nr:hypothetical protein [Armatimonadota bacterium]
MPTEAEKDLLRLNRLPVEPLKKPRVSRSRKTDNRARATPRALIRRYFVIFAVLAVLFEGATYAIRPFCAIWLVSRDTPALERKVKEERQKQEDLKWQLKFAESPRGAVALSRDYGYIKPGEVPFVLPGQDQLAQRLTAPEPQTVTLWDKVMTALCKVSRAGPEIVQRDSTKN